MSGANPSVNSGHWVTMTCQCRFADCNKCITRVGGEADSWGGCGRGWGRTGVGGGIWELFVLSAQFFCEPKTALKTNFMN